MVNWKKLSAPLERNYFYPYRDYTIHETLTFYHVGIDDTISAEQN